MRIQYIFKEEVQAELRAEISGVSVDLTCPLAPVRRRLRALVRMLRQGALRLHHDVDLLPAIHLLRSGEQPRGATRDLRDDGKGGELACAECAVVLCDLRELGEEGEQDGPELCYGKRAGKCSEQRKSDCEGGKDGGVQHSSWVVCGGERSGRGSVVEDDEEGDKDVLDS